MHDYQVFARQLRSPPRARCLATPQSLATRRAARPLSLAPWERRRRSRRGQRSRASARWIRDGSRGNSAWEEIREERRRTPPFKCRVGGGIAHLFRQVLLYLVHVFFLFVGAGQKLTLAMLATATLMQLVTMVVVMKSMARIMKDIAMMVVVFYSEGGRRHVSIHMQMMREMSVETAMMAGLVMVRLVRLNCVHGVFQTARLTRRARR